LAEETGASITQILLSYFKTLPIPTIPLIGPRDISQVEDMMSNIELKEFWEGL